MFYQYFFQYYLAQQPAHDQHRLKAKDNAKNSEKIRVLHRT